MIVAATGHRPDKLGGYSIKASELRIRIAQRWLTQHHKQIKELIVGMALGWDQDVAIAGIKLRLKIHAAIPFVSQAKVWSVDARAQYDYILSMCYKRTVVCEGDYSPYKMQVRNEWMVDRCSLLLECFDGSKGGTFNCDRYARAKCVQIVNLYDEFNKIVKITLLK